MHDRLDTLAKQHHDVIVVGAGVAGLSAALTATAAGKKTLVLDAHDVGGRARTSNQSGFAHNLGPHALYSAGRLAQLLAHHGIHIAGGRPDATKVDLYRDGTLTPLTMKATDIMRTKLLGRRDRVKLLKLLASIQHSSPGKLIGTSVDEWLADQPLAVRQFIDMFVRLSTYTNSPATLDAGAVLQQLQMSLSSGVEYLDDGWASMVAAMSAVITSRGGELVTGAEVAAIRAEGRGVEVHTGTHVLHGSAAVVAAGGPSLTERLSGARVAGAENLTSSVEAETLDLALSTPHTGLALGLDRPLYLAAHAPLAKLAPSGQGLVSIIRYVAFETLSSAPAHRAESRAELRALATLAGIRDSDVVHERYFHRLTVTHGAPTAAGGGLAGRPGATALGIPGVFIAGDWVGPEGLIADASAASGQAAATLCLAAPREHAR